MVSSPAQTTVPSSRWAKAVCGSSTGISTETLSVVTTRRPRVAAYPCRQFKLPAAAPRFDELVENGGAVVTGRRTYDIADAWGGNGPAPVLPLFVLTHHVPEHVPQGESHYTFVTDGVDSAIAQAKAAAGDKYVSLMGSAVPQQCLRAGLLDEIQIHLVPVLLGAGVRLFDHLGAESIQLETLRVVDSPGVTHLRFHLVK
jgi:dihydrofolate reductase